MRFDFNIVWLDDDWETELSSGNLENLEETIKKHLSNLGYDANVFKISKKEEVDNAIDKRTDLFLSDYNLATDFKGIDFLKILRKKLTYQEVLIYTNGGIDEIRAHLHNILDENDGMQILQKFSFCETKNLDSDIIKLIKNITNRISELNMLRGLYTSEVGKIESTISDLVLHGYRKELKDVRDNIINNGTISDFMIKHIISEKEKHFRHSEYFKQLNSKKIDSLVDDLKLNDFNLKLEIFLEMYPEINEDFPEFQDESNKIRKLRNSLAHGEEKYDNESKNYYISIDSNQKIYDTNITDLRKQLKNYMNTINLIFSKICTNSMNRDKMLSK